MLRSSTEAARETVQSGLNTANQTFQRMTDQVAQVMGFNGPQSEELARRSSQNLQAVTQASTVLARGFQEASNEVLRFVQDRLTKNVDSLNRLAGCRSVQDVVAVQSELVRETLWQVIDANKRVAELSLRIADEAALLSRPKRTGMQIAPAARPNPGFCAREHLRGPGPAPGLWPASSWADLYRAISGACLSCKVHRRRDQPRGAGWTTSMAAPSKLSVRNRLLARSSRRTSAFSNRSSSAFPCGFPPAWSSRTRPYASVFPGTGHRVRGGHHPSGPPPRSRDHRTGGPDRTSGPAWAQIARRTSASFRRRAARCGSGLTIFAGRWRPVPHCASSYCASCRPSRSRWARRRSPTAATILNGVSRVGC